MCNNTHDSGVERGISKVIKNLARLVTDRVFYQVTHQAIEKQKNQRGCEMRRYVNSLPPCEALDYIKQHYPELFEPLNHKQKQL